MAIREGVVAPPIDAHGSVTVCAFTAWLKASKSTSRIRPLIFTINTHNQIEYDLQQPMHSYCYSLDCRLP
jgi:hypothetical protein